MQTALPSARSVDPRCPGSKDKASKTKYHYEAAGYGEVKRHGVDPAGGIGKVLANPEKKHGCDHSELAGDDEQCVPPLTAFVEKFDLVWSEVALFGGK
jgi:hypothetical protein